MKDELKKFTQAFTKAIRIEMEEMRRKLGLFEIPVYEAMLVVSNLLAGERFDTVIIEEAGMTVLPAVFHCASLARHSVILIGDPRQLPPIVQSSDAYVWRAMGRSIFDVTVPDAAAAPCVALLNVQYRMNPAIGSLVSDLFYGGSPISLTINVVLQDLL